MDIHYREGRTVIALSRYRYTLMLRKQLEVDTYSIDILVYL
jgi:hypothetical protein